VALDRLTVALVALLVVAWLLPGALEWGHLPHGGVVLIDLLDVLALAWLAVRRVRSPGRFWLPAVARLYFAWVALGLITHAPWGAVATSTEHFVVLPLLAVVLAAEGAPERRARAIVAAIFALAAVEFLITLKQSFTASNPDFIVGSFGSSANAVAACLILIAASLGFAGYAVGAKWGPAALAAAAALPVFTAWSLAKAAPLMLPVVAAAIVLPALLDRRLPVSRAATIVGAAVVSSVAVLGSYAIYNRDSFDALFRGRLLSNYLNTASATSSIASFVPAILSPPYVFADYDNAGLAASDGDVVVRNVAAGDFTAYIRSEAGTGIAVRPGSRLAAQVVATLMAGESRSVQIQFEWHSRTGELLSTTLGPAQELSQARTTASLAALASVPPGAASVAPKLAFLGSGTGITVRLSDFSLEFSPLVLSDYVNATVVPMTTAPLGFTITSRRPSDFTAQSGATAVTPQQLYELSGSVVPVAPTTASVHLELAWHASDGTSLGSIAEDDQPLRARGGSLKLVAAAPAAATSAIARVAVTGVHGLTAAAVSGLRLENRGYTLSNFVNAVVTPRGEASSGFTISNATAGDYTAQVGTGEFFGIAPHGRVGLGFGVVDSGPRTQQVQAQLEFRDASGAPIRTTNGRPVALAAHATRRFTLAGHAPAGTAAVIPKVVVFGSPATSPPPAQSFVVLSRVTLEGRFRTAASPTTSTSPSTTSPSPPPSPPHPTTATGGPAARSAPTPVPPRATATPAAAPAASRPVVGRVDQWRAAERLVSRSWFHRLFGNGAGSATVAENLGISANDLTPDQESASYSDFGSLLAERGYTGIATVAVLVALLTLASIRLARRLPPSRWATATTVAVPGLLATMALYGLIADQLRSRPVALTFWLLVAVAFSPATASGRPSPPGRSDRSGERLSSAGVDERLHPELELDERPEPV
jgi:hypothetical protein